MVPKAYIQYLVHFHGDRDYFECHEILEEYWKELNEGKQSVWIGFILLAVSNYHFRRGNQDGAGRTLKKAITIFEDHLHNQSFGMDMNSLCSQLEIRLIGIQQGEAYSSFNLPLTDSNILEECKRVCHTKGFQWGQNSNLEDVNLIHRHSKRDRSDIVRQRQIALSQRHAK